MKFAEIIEKTKNNLKIQEDLKVSIANSEQLEKDLEEKLVKAKENLDSAKLEEVALKEKLILDLKDQINNLNDNLDFIVFSPYECGLEFKFLKKQYNLLAIDHVLKLNDQELKPELFVEELFDKYISNGKVMFNDATIAKMQEINTIYQTEPQVMLDTVVNLDINKKVGTLKKQEEQIKTSIKETLVELEVVNIDIKKSREFKSPILKKVFNKKERLEKDAENLYQELDRLNRQLDKVQNKLNNKNALKDESVAYARAELESLKCYFTLIENFESAKLKLAKYREQYINYIKMQIKDIEEKLASTKTKIKEDKGMLQLNKKINNEIVYNAFGNEKFVDELNANKSIRKEDESAYKYIKVKYNDYLQGCIEQLVL